MTIPVGSSGFPVTSTREATTLNDLVRPSRHAASATEPLDATRSPFWRYGARPRVGALTGTSEETREGNRRERATRNGITRNRYGRNSAFVAKRTRQIRRAR